MKGTEMVQIKCWKMDDSQKLANALNMSELNGSKIVAEFVLKHGLEALKRRQEHKKRKVMSKLSRNKSGSKAKIVKKGKSSGKGKLTTKGKKGKKGKKGGK